MPETISIAELKIAEIAESPSNPRKTFGDLSELTESIKTKGVLQPVLVRPIPAGQISAKVATADYELVFGARRLRAAEDLRPGVALGEVALRSGRAGPH